MVRFIAHGDVIQHCNGLCFTRSGIETYIENLGLYVCLLSDGLFEKEKIILVKTFTSSVLGIVENFSRLVVLRESKNILRCSKDHPVLPIQLGHLPPWCFYNLKKKHSENLRANFFSQEIEDIKVRNTKFRKDQLVLAAPEES